MKPIMKNLTGIVLSAGLLILNVCAASNCNIEYSGGNTPVRFSGRASSGRAGQIVTIKIIDEDAETTLDPYASIVFAKQITTGRDGEYSLNAEIDSNLLGDLEAVVIIDTEEPVTRNIYKATNEEIAATIGRLNAGRTLESIVNAAKAPTLDPEAINDVKVLMVNISEFEASNASGLLSEVIRKAALEKRFATTSIVDFNNAYKTGLFLVDIEGGETGEGILNKMEANADVLNAPQKNALNVFNDYSQAEKIAITSKFSGRRFETKSEFFDAIYEQVILKELAACSNNTEKFEKIKENNDHLSLPISTYEGLKTAQFTNFKTELFKVTYASVETLKSECARLYTKYSNVREDKDDGGKTGGGTISGGMPMNPTVGSDMISTPGVSGENFFNDLEGYEWALASIHALAKQGVINGKAYKTFAPADCVTRAEFVKMLIGALEITSENTGKTFKDVPDSHWAKSFVDIASSTEIISGTSDDVFGADHNITRQDMAVMCFRAIKFLDGEISASSETIFADNENISDYAKEAVAALSKMGVINGKGNNIFDPRNVATRAEAAKVIYALLGR